MNLRVNLSKANLPVGLPRSLAARLLTKIIGAAANVIVSENSAKHGHVIKFLEFMKYGIIVVFISLALSSAYIWVRHFI